MTPMMPGGGHYEKYRPLKNQSKRAKFFSITGRVRDPYGKLWTEFFLPFMAQARRAMKTRKEYEDP